MSKRIMGRIVAVDKKVHTETYLATKIKKKDQKKYSRYPGGFGTYVTGSKYNGVSIEVKIYVFDEEKYLHPIDIREYVLKMNGKKIVSSKLLNYVIENNNKKKVALIKTDKGYFFDQSQLDVVMKK